MSPFRWGLVWFSSLFVYVCICIYNCIYIIYPVILEYRIEILASQGIPIIELENSYLEYS